MVKSDNKKGNPYHDEEGKFTSINGVTERSINVIPKTTSAGKPRRFYSDYTPEEKENLLNSYGLKYRDKIQKIKELGEMFPTYKDNSTSRQMLRLNIINDEFEEQMKTPKKKEKKATIILGLPGSGKSRIANILSEQDGSFIIDADNFKQRIPEFQKDQLMVSAVHKESVDLSNQFRNELSDQGYNMVIGKVGGDIGSVDYVVDELEQKGYNISVVLNDVPLEVALDRTIGRFERGETKRLVPIHTTLNADKNIFNVFDYLMARPSVRNGKIYNNDVPIDQDIILLKEYKK